MLIRFLYAFLALIFFHGSFPMAHPTCPACSPAGPSTSPETSISDTTTPSDSSVDTSADSSADTSTQPPVDAPAVSVSTDTPDISGQDATPATAMPLTFSFPVSYDFSQPLPECAPVGNDYFADAAFVGDSRTEGFFLYSKVNQGKLISYTGLSVFGAAGAKVININGRKGTVVEALSTGQYSKIYLSFGVNELGYRDSEAFYRTYCQLIDSIRAIHPNAIIYIQTIIPVNDQRAAATGHSRHVNCDRVRDFNDIIRRVARDKRIPLLDIYSFFAVDGQLPLEASRDGVHLVPDYCVKQLEFYRTHAIPVSAAQPAAPKVEASSTTPAAKPTPSTPAPAPAPSTPAVPKEPTTPVEPTEPNTPAPTTPSEQPTPPVEPAPSTPPAGTTTPETPTTPIETEPEATVL